MEMTGLKSLNSRREQRSFEFSLTYLDHDKNSRLFLLNPMKTKETCIVTFAKTETYRKSAVPHCQRRLNKHIASEEQKKKMKK